MFDLARWVGEDTLNKLVAVVTLAGVLPFAILVSCFPQPGGGGPAPPPASSAVAEATKEIDPLVIVGRHLTDPSWVPQVDPFKDTAPIPQAGGLEYLPEQALGFTWAVALGPDLDPQQTCRTVNIEKTDSKSLKIIPLGTHVDRAKCRLKNIGSQRVYQFRTTGKQAGSLSIAPFLSGDANSAGAFEVMITHPAHVTFEDPQSCLPEADVRAIGFQEQDRVCEVYWVYLVKQTQIYSRSFAEMTKEGGAAFSIIKIGGSLYSSSEQMSETTIITGNHSSLTQYMTRVASSGYVIKSRPSTPAPVPSTAPAPVGVADIASILDDRVRPDLTVTVDTARKGLAAQGPGVTTVDPVPPAPPPAPKK